MAALPACFGCNRAPRVVGEVIALLLGLSNAAADKADAAEAQSRTDPAHCSEMIYLRKTCRSLTPFASLSCG